eukprot:6192438-Pleurochrysis_carterae.AAC.2
MQPTNPLTRAGERPQRRGQAMRSGRVGGHAERSGGRATRSGRAGAPRRVAGEHRRGISITIIDTSNTFKWLPGMVVAKASLYCTESEHEVKHGPSDGEVLPNVAIATINLN